MVTDTSFSFSFPLRSREVVGRFNGGSTSSDGGLLLLAHLDKQLGLTERLAECISDRRQQSKVVQSVRDMLRQRVYGICLGYEDCNDFDTICADPVFKLASDRLPQTDPNLASQPTLCRFENSIDRKDLIRLSRQMVEHFIVSHPNVKHIVLDIDATDDAAHGQQELEFFHGYYGHHCFLPLLIFASTDGLPEQHLITSVLRPGNKHAGHRIVSVLRRIVARLHQSYPDALITLRGDAGFALPAVYALCEEQGIDYVLSLPKNARLLNMSEPLLTAARQECEQTKLKARHFGEISYAAASWPHERRVVVKAEVMPRNGDNPRFVVTNCTDLSAEALYEFYTQRGDAENRIKELKDDLASGRTSCHRFVANQFRLLMHSAAMILMQALRQLLAGTTMDRMQASTLRVKLLKVGTAVVQTSRKIWLRLPSSYPHQDVWGHLTAALGLGVT